MRIRCFLTFTGKEEEGEESIPKDVNFFLDKVKLPGQF